MLKHLTSFTKPRQRACLTGTDRTRRKFYPTRSDPS